MISKTIAIVVVAISTFMAANPQQPLRKITIGLSSGSLATSASRLASEMGFFEKHGLDAKVMIISNSTVATSGLISGSLDFNSLAATEVVVAQGVGQQVVAVANVFNGFPGSLTLSKAAVEKIENKATLTSSVRDKLKALDGLLIGSPAATSTMTLSLKRPVDNLGSAIRFTYIAQPAMAAALETGAIDGYMSSAPFYAPPVLKGNAVVWLSGPKGEFPSDYSPGSTSVNTTRAFAEANPDVVKKLQAALADFSKAVSERPAEVKAAIAKLYPNLDASSVDLVFESESKSLQAKPMSTEMMAHEIAFVKATGTNLPQLEKLQAKDLVYP